jgi:GNAT superfamily N-acetyltransferase
MDEAQVLADIEARRKAGVVFDGRELTRRIDDLGDIVLSSAGRHGAFAELYGAFTPKGFRLVPFPDDSQITVSDHRVRVRAVIIDDAHGQVVAEIERDVLLDHGIVRHDLLRVQDAYRGEGLSYVLLERALELYRQLGLGLVVVHAALETGRWHWARLGFDFVNDRERSIVMGWAMMALVGLGQTPLDPASPARRLAQLGTGSPSDQASLEDVRAAVDAQLAIWHKDPALRHGADLLAAEWDRRSLSETGQQLRILEPARVKRIAAANAMTATDPMALGKAIMLAGPDWLGSFDLNDQPSLDAFEREFSRRFSGR